MSKSFINKLFSKKVAIDYAMMGFVQTLKINPPTDKEVEKVLHQILHKEGGIS